MSTLANTNINPSLVDNPLEQTDINAQASKKHKQAVAEALAGWSAFHNTDQGRTCEDLAGPKIKQLNDRLSTSTSKLMKELGLPLEGIQEARAEWRGQRSVWYDIMYSYEYLKSQLDAVEQNLKGKEAVSEKLTWKSIPNKVRKRLTNQPEYE